MKRNGIAYLLNPHRLIHSKKILAMPKTTSEILSIISAGASVIIAYDIPARELMLIAGAAKRKGVKVIVRHEKSTQEIMSLTRAAGGNMIFELNK